MKRKQYYLRYTKATPIKGPKKGVEGMTINQTFLSLKIARKFALRVKRTGSIINHLLNDQKIRLPL